jgi:hypothetical protein
VDGGVEMTDIVHYKIPLWFLGDIANVVLVKSKLQVLFRYRYEKVEAIFNSRVGE